MAYKFQPVTREEGPMSKIQLFLQFEGSRRVELIQLDSDALVADVLEAGVKLGFPDEHRAEAHVFGSDNEISLKLNVPLSKQGICDKHRVHIHRCRKVEVTLHFNELTEVMPFPPAITVDHVKKRFVHAIGMSPVDATEHVLQICGSDDRPEPDTQIGTLVSGCCSLCFNLVPIKRVEG